MATPAPTRSGGDISTFNIQHGFPEALVRGMRSSFLQDQDYHHVQQCETLDDVRLNLTESDYAEAIADFNSLTPNTLQKAAVEKVRQYVLCNSDLVPIHSCTKKAEESIQIRTHITSFLYLLTMVPACLHLLIGMLMLSLSPSSSTCAVKL